MKRRCYYKVRGRYVTARQARTGKKKKKSWKSAWPRGAYAGY